MARRYLSWLMLAVPVFAADPAYRSDYYRVETAAAGPGSTVLALDSLGNKKFETNLLRHSSSTGTFTVPRVGNEVEYRAQDQTEGEPPAWTFSFSPGRIDGYLTLLAALDRMEGVHADER